MSCGPRPLLLTWEAHEIGYRCVFEYQDYSTPCPRVDVSEGGEQGVLYCLIVSRVAKHL